MTAKSLVSSSLFSLRPADTAEQALAWMDEMKIAQLPVAEGDIFEGIVTEDDLLNADDPYATVADVPYQRAQNAYVMEDTHFYDILKTATDYRLEAIPVLDPNKRLIGTIGLSNLLTGLSEVFAVQTEGSVLVLDIPPKSYSPAEIGRIVESVDGLLVSLYLTRSSEDGRSQITLKVNVNDLDGLVAAFERFGYRVVERHFHASPSSVQTRNYAALMRMLEV